VCTSDSDPKPALVNADPKAPFAKTVDIVSSNYAIYAAPSALLTLVEFSVVALLD
jgi:hypothetical protein